MPETKAAPVVRNNGFSVDLFQDKNATWISVGGLDSNIDPSVEETVGKDSIGHIRAVPGERKTNDLTLTRFATKDKFLADWYKEAVLDGNFEKARKNITIKVFDTKRTPVAEVSVIGAIPVSIKYGDFSAENPELQTEEITVVFENWERVK
jgi:phage tail-like protein